MAKNQKIIKGQESEQVTICDRKLYDNQSNGIMKSQNATSRCGRDKNFLMFGLLI